MVNKLQRFISSTVFYHDFERAVNTAQSLNCGLEISRFGKLSEIDENYEKNKIEYKKILNDFEGDVTLHGFFSNLNVAAKDPLIQQVSVKRYNQTLDLASEFDVKKVVLHTCLNNLLKQKSYQEMFFLKNIEFFKEYIKNYENLGIIVGMENVHEPNPDYIRNLIGAINSPYFKATLDIGHCNLHSDLSCSEWIKEYGIMLTHLHFHNNFKDEDSHSSLLNGNIDIKEILKTLKDMQLYPTITFEIFDFEALVESVKYFNDLCDELDIGYC
ncbi:MAG: sugar phosphate isomerase/epimerase [Candidatus Gastranaerophilales bacterium]|nr:sugar phosphate isomerase/epimerase [Candidatus Gastranaerophilales bacterium]